MRAPIPFPCIPIAGARGLLADATRYSSEAPVESLATAVNEVTQPAAPSGN